MPKSRRSHPLKAPRRSDAADAFFPDPGGGPIVAPDAFAEELAEEFLASATTGQEQAPDAYDQVVEEEAGGPFVPSSRRKEFARGRKGQPDFEMEAFPTPSAAVVIDESTTHELSLDEEFDDEEFDDEEFDDEEE